MKYRPTSQRPSNKSPVMRGRGDDEGDCTKGTVCIGIAGMAGKGRRNIASRVREIVQALALCHNVRTVQGGGWLAHRSFG